MKISKELIIPVLESHAALAKEDSRTWKIRFEPKVDEWSLSDMKDTIGIFQNMGYIEDVYDEELLVSDQVEGLRLHIEGIHNISMYCQTENPTVSRGKWSRYSIIQNAENTQIPDLFSLRISSHVDEERFIDENIEVQDWSSSIKHYEIIKKIIYIDPSSDIKYIVSMTKKSKDLFPNMILSNVTGEKPIVEYSMECPSDMEPLEIMTSIVHMIQVIEQNMFPMTVDQQKEVLLNYDTLVDKVRDKKWFKDPYYLAPKPMTLELVHLSDPITYGQMSILDGYAVTDKADGERMLLFIDKKGDTYLINNAFEVRATGWSVKREQLYDTILDGEYLAVHKRLDKSEHDLFMAFDVYFVGGESVMNLPLVSVSSSSSSTSSSGDSVETNEKSKNKEKTIKKESSSTSTAKITGKNRMEIMKAVLDSPLWKNDPDAILELDYKEHIAANGQAMFAACRKILDDAMRENARYDIDGLIFTPTQLPVLGFYPDKPVVIKTASATWDRVLKWKPPHQNSIDFHVSLDKNPVKDIKFKKNYAKFLLQCGYSTLRNEEISVARGLELVQTPISKRDLKDDYKLHPFTPQHHYEYGIQYAYIPYSVDGTLRAENGDEITDGSIVEFGYDLQDKRGISYRWRAMRVRNDKMRNIITPSSDEAQETSIKKQKNQIKTIKANDWKTATSIWHSIHQPISKDMITGVIRAPQLVQKELDLNKRLLGTDAIYYGRNVMREHLLSVDMLNFHNSVIKDNLYRWQQKIPKTNLLELACGMAGDMNRWSHSTGLGFKNVLGVDLVRDNITKAVDGAYARVLKQRLKMNTVFVIGDCSKPLHTGAAAKGLDRDSEEILLELYDKKTSSKKRHLTFFQPFAKNKFDMVSCQFAIHYFFETQQKLEGFMANVRDNLKPGGLFIATFMDGASVEKLIKERGTNGLVTGKSLDKKVTIWAIRRIAEVAKDELQLDDEHEEGQEDVEQSEQSEFEFSNETSSSMFSSSRSKEFVNIYNKNKPNDELQLELVDVPGQGDCMFISLEIAAYGKEISENKNGYWMRSKIIEKMKEILRRGSKDKDASELYEKIMVNIEGLSPDVKEEAIESIKSELLTEKSDTYLEKVSGYLKWMGKPKTWGTELELQIAADVFERPVHLYQDIKSMNKIEMAYTFGDSYKTKSPVRIWYNRINHYKALIDVDKSSSSSTVESSSATAVSSTTASSSSSSVSTTESQQVITNATKSSPFGRLIDVYLENTNRLIPEYLVDFDTLMEYATRYGLELVQDAMFSDTYQAFRQQQPENPFPSFDANEDLRRFSFLNRWVVFRRK